jgi:hypothetical protein
VAGSCRHGRTYCQIDAAAIIFAASIIIWRTGVLSEWTTEGAILRVPPPGHSWLPLPAAMSSMDWIVAIGLVMLIAAENTAPIPLEPGEDTAPRITD